MCELMRRILENEQQARNARFEREAKRIQAQAEGKASEKKHGYKVESASTGLHELKPEM